MKYFELMLVAAPDTFYMTCSKASDVHQFEPLSGQIIQAALAVHHELGPGFLETVYQNAICVALGMRSIPYETQKRISIVFAGTEVGTHCLDLVVQNLIVVELKSVKALTEIHYAQLRSYLKASGLKIGLLLNFNAPLLTIRRFMN